jgi:hypothetical protein
MVAAALGSQLSEDPLKLVKGATDGFGELLATQGMEVTHAAALCTQLEFFAARTLTASACPDLPAGFVAAVQKALEVSNELARTA